MAEIFFKFLKTLRYKVSILASLLQTELANKRGEVQQLQVKLSEAKSDSKSLVKAQAEAEKSKLQLEEARQQTSTAQQQNKDTKLQLEQLTAKLRQLEVGREQRVGGRRGSC